MLGQWSRGVGAHIGARLGEGWGAFVCRAEGFNGFLFFLDRGRFQDGEMCVVLANG